ncbi:uncharacterized protein ARMOST_13098 [Armillaria ostoyae]|uniref:Uncharacterized protein n=1 Tax=Armillaria ostoyae TaxID=47428 RepID=A0A284RLS1_ARMOS|nr:uncharacterized protein ARMOST_13098 [Armillaria ostoyae]
MPTLSYALLGYGSMRAPLLYLMDLKRDSQPLLLFIVKRGRGASLGSCFLSATPHPLHPSTIESTVVYYRCVSLHRYGFVKVIQRI